MATIIKKRKGSDNYMMQIDTNIISPVEYKTPKEAYDSIKRYNKFIHELYHRVRSKASY